MCPTNQGKQNRKLKKRKDKEDKRMRRGWKGHINLRHKEKDKKKIRK